MNYEMKIIFKKEDMIRLYSLYLKFQENNTTRKEEEELKHLNNHYSLSDAKKEYRKKFPYTKKVKKAINNDYMMDVTYSMKSIYEAYNESIQY